MVVWLLPEKLGWQIKQKTQQLKWLWSNDTKDSTINQRLVEQNTRGNFRLEGSGSSTLDDTLRKQYLSSSDE